MCIGGREHPGLHLRCISETAPGGHHHISHYYYSPTRSLCFPYLTALCPVFTLQVLIRHSQRRHTGPTPISALSKRQRNHVAVCRLVVDGAHVDPWSPLAVGPRLIKVFLALKNNTRRRRGTRPSVVARHCSTAYRPPTQWHHPPPSRFSPYRSVSEFAAPVLWFLWAGAKNRGPATIQQIKLRDPGEFIRAMWGQTEMPSDSERP